MYFDLYAPPRARTDEQLQQREDRTRKVKVKVTCTWTLPACFVALTSGKALLELAGID
jgi:hypothetical protein